METEEDKYCWLREPVLEFNRGLWDGFENVQYSVALMTRRAVAFHHDTIANRTYYIYRAELQYRKRSWISRLLGRKWHDWLCAYEYDITELNRGRYFNHRELYMVFDCKGVQHSPNRPCLSDFPKLWTNTQLRVQLSRVTGELRTNLLDEAITLREQVEQHGHQDHRS